MRIVIVIPNLGAGGAERVVTMLAGAWTDRGHRVTVATIDGTRPDFYDLDPRVERVTLDGAPRAVERMLGRLTRIWPLRRFLAASHPDVVVSLITVTNLLTLVAAAGLGIPIVVNEQLDPRQHRIPALMKVARDVLYRRAAALVVLTEGVADWARTRIGSRVVHVIPNFARQAPSRRPAGGCGSRRIVAIGRLVPQKGFDMLLDAFATCVSLRPGWTLQILGEGSDGAELAARARALGISDLVELPGVVSDPERRLARAEIFALSSRYEGFPLALAEAMAAALPVVAFDCPTGPSELVRHEVDGLLVTPGDVRAFAEALGRLMDDPDLRERLSARAPEVTERFSVDRVVGMWTDLVTTLGR